MTDYTVTLNDNDLAVIAAGLGELQLKVAKPTWDKIQAQIAAVKAAEEATPPVGGTD